MRTDTRDFECFEAKQNDDKFDLELTCVHCFEVICDIEVGDSLDVLMRTAMDHHCGDVEEETR